MAEPRKADRRQGSAQAVSLQDRLALRPAEAARALGLSERALRQILPQLPHLHAGSAVLIPVDSLREWLREQAHASAKDAKNVVEGVLRDLASRDG